MILLLPFSTDTLRGKREEKIMSQSFTRKYLQELVKGIIPHDELERDHIDDVIEWIESGADLYRVKKPDVPPKHLVSYFVVIDPDNACLLLGDHIKAQLWLPSGGHVEPDEDPKMTVTRECREELGKDAVFLRSNDKPFFITVNQTVGLTSGHTDVSLWYLVRARRHEFVDFERREFNDIEWFTFQEILESSPVIFDKHMHRFTRKLINYLDS